VYARIMTTQASPGLALDKEETVKLWQDHLAQIYTGAKGFRQAYVLGNPGESQGVTVTLWDSEQDADDSGTFEQVLLHIRDGLALPPIIDGYDVLYQMEAGKAAQGDAENRG
jgi:heme-degrading monooxygenase HmoA